jgi:LacI family transcriptional regulator
MGKRGAQVLLERIANREKEYPSEIVMAPELVVRESTGAAPGPLRKVFDLDWTPPGSRDELHER